MRTVCSILDLNDISHSQQDISIFEDQITLDENDQGFNPLGYQTPTLVHENQTVIGDAPTIYKFLCLSNIGDKIEENFYPRKKMNSERKKIIDNYLEYIDSMITRNTSRLTKIVI